MNQSHKTQQEKYGGLAGYRAEMKRRRSLVKTAGGFASMDKAKHLEASRHGGKNRWRNKHAENQETQASGQSS